jgi:hypothetical protein
LADIAQIGFRADTSDLADAKVKLEALTPAAGRAEKASEKLAAAMNGTGSAAEKAAAGIKSVDSAADQAAAGMTNFSTKMNGAVVGTQNYNSHILAYRDNLAKVGTQMKFTAREGLNFSRQLSDIGVTAAMGMNPFMILLQQGPQLFDIIQEKAIVTGTTIGAVFRAAGVAIWTALAPLLPILAGVALAIGAVAAGFALGAREINKGNKSVIDGLNLTEKQLERVKKSGVDTAVTMGDTFFAFFDVIGDRLTAAFEGPLKWLSDAWTTTLDYITKYGAKAIEFIIGANNGAVYAIRNSWRTLPAALGDIMISIANSQVQTIEWMINKVIAGINATVAFANDMAAKVGWTTGLGPLGNVSLGRVANPFEGSAKQMAGEVASGIAQGMNEAKGVVGRFFEDVGKAARKRAASRILAAAGKAEKGAGGAADKPDKVNDTFDMIKNAGKLVGASGRDMGTDMKKIMDRAKAFQDIVTGGQEAVKQLEMEQAALGMTAQQADRARIMYDLLAQARQANLTLGPVEVAALGQLADKQAALNEEIANMRDAMDFAKGSFRGFIGDLISGAQQGQSVFKTFGDAILNVLNRVLDKMLDFATQAAFGGGNGAGGFFGNLLKIVGGSVGASAGGSGMASSASSLLGSIGAGLVPHAKGGVIGSPMMFDMAGGRTGVAGEAGQEGILPLQRGPDGSLGVQMYGDGQAGASVNNVEVHNHYHLSGAISSDDVQKMVRSGSEAAATQTRDAVRRALPSWLNDYQQNGALV